MLRPLRVLLVFVAVLLAACVFTTSAPADDDDDDGGAPPQLVDSAEGEGTAFGGRSSFQFSVTSGPNGGAASGLASLTNVAGLPFSGPPTCLNVSGARATFEIDNTDPLTAAMGDVVVFVGDFGTPSGVPEVDEFNFHFMAPDAADASCPDPATRLSERTVDPGSDIVVKDNVLLPSGGDEDDDDDEGDDDD